MVQGYQKCHLSTPINGKVTDGALRISQTSQATWAVQNKYVLLKGRTKLKEKVLGHD